MPSEIQQPKQFDIVGDPVLVGGIGQQGFEATLNWRVHDGHDERTGFFNVGGGSGEHGQFQVAAAIGNAAFQLDRVFVEVFEESAADGSEINKVVVPVIFGPRIVPGYLGFRLHVVARGETLSQLPAERTAIQVCSPALFVLTRSLLPTQTRSLLASN